jgi:hypothetical protein
VTSIIVSTVIAILLWPSILLTQNYLRLRPLGLPILISPFGRLNPFWIILQPYVELTLAWLSALEGPFAIFDFAIYSTSNWSIIGRHKHHLYQAPAFLIVSPGATELMVADPATVLELFKRNKDFIHSTQRYKPLEIFGPNIVTVNGYAWARHRQIIAPPLNERNSQLVWKESLTLADQILNIWIEHGKGSVGGVENTLKIPKRLR